jgi:hypothetical protein
MPRMKPHRRAVRVHWYATSKQSDELARGRLASVAAVAEVWPAALDRAAALGVV